MAALRQARPRARDSRRRRRTGPARARDQPAAGWRGRGRGRLRGWRRGRGPLRRPPRRQGHRRLLRERAAPDQGPQDRRGAQAAAAGDRGGRAPRLLRAGLTLRSPYDREILKLAVPALGALAAEPLYLLADTAMVGHLGTEQLAALAIAATLLTGAFTLFNFLTYGTTAQVARLSGAAEHGQAGSLAAQALWLATGIGVVLVVVLVSLAVPLVDLMGGHGHTGELAVMYLRIGSLGLPFALIALAGQGFLRG